jgi:ABC-type antimicrobial peptide transport system permease subunit
MLKNYFTIAWRNLLKSRLNAFINILGLATGMAVALLIALWIWDALSFNKDNRNYPRIAQVMQTLTLNGSYVTWSGLPYPLAEALRKDYGSDFKHVTLASPDRPVLSFGDKNLSQTGLFMEPQGPDMLDLKMIAGSRAGLTDPNSILLSESTAKAYFGNADPLHQPLLLNNLNSVTVTGVYKDLPRNSSFSNLAFVGTWALRLQTTGWIRDMQNPWGNNAFQVYVQLNDHANLAAVSGKIKDVKLQNIRPQERIAKAALFLQPMHDWYLYSEFKNGINTGGRITYIWLFGIIGGFVLLLACINFMNLSTARSQKRAREVGVRKTFGSLRSQLIGQFLGESVFLTAIAFVIAIGLTLLALPYFNILADKEIVFPWRQPYFWLLSIGFTLFTGLLSGSYPAFYLSHFNPIRVLKGDLHAGRFSALPRKVLVVLQFTVSIVLLIGTVVVYRQIQFAKDRPVGYSREGLLTVYTHTQDIQTHFDAVRHELQQGGAIVDMAQSYSAITGVGSSNGGMSWKGKPAGSSNDFPMSHVSYDYGKTVGWQIVAGRDFSRAFAATDSSAFIINESAARYMGLQHPIGEKIAFNDGVAFTVIGVIKDFVMESPYEPVRPSLFRLTRSSGSVLNIRINPTISAHEALGQIERTFAKYSAGQPFEYKFVDEQYDRKFGEEQRIGRLATVFSILAIFISCLGLFALASFTAEQRTVEIGIRKVLGSSVFQVWRLLTREFVLLVLLALLIAIPLAAYGMQIWLGHYTYHAPLSWWIFVLAASSSLGITILTVSFQAIKAAMANPARALRSE